jgi:hypothetical protein
MYSRVLVAVLLGLLVLASAKDGHHGGDDHHGSDHHGGDDHHGPSMDGEGCTFTSPNFGFFTYDLKSFSTANYQVSDSQGNVYYFNLCKGVTGHCTPSDAVCIKTPSGRYISGGKLSTASYSDLSTSAGSLLPLGVSVSFTEAHQTTSISLECDVAGNSSEIASVENDGNSRVTITVKTPAACPVNAQEIWTKIDSCSQLASEESCLSESKCECAFCVNSQTCVPQEFLSVCDGALSCRIGLPKSIVAVTLIVSVLIALCLIGSCVALFLICSRRVSSPEDEVEDNESCYEEEATQNVASPLLHEGRELDVVVSPSSQEEEEIQLRQALMNSLKDSSSLPSPLPQGPVPIPVEGGVYPPAMAFYGTPYLYFASQEPFPFNPTPAPAPSNQ